MDGRIWEATPVAQDDPVDGPRTLWLVPQRTAVTQAIDLVPEGLVLEINSSSCQAVEIYLAIAGGAGAEYAIEGGRESQVFVAHALACAHSHGESGIYPCCAPISAASHAGLVVGMFEGHPDDLWGGHDWDVWWAWLTPQERTQLLDLAWGEEPVMVVGQKVTMLRGATYEVKVETLENGRPRTITRDLATDELLVFLEEQRHVERRPGQ